MASEKNVPVETLPPRRGRDGLALGVLVLAVVAVPAAAVVAVCAAHFCWRRRKKISRWIIMGSDAAGVRGERAVTRDASVLQERPSGGQEHEHACLRPSSFRGGVAGLVCGLVGRCFGGQPERRFCVFFAEMLMEFFVTYVLAN